MSHRPVTSKGYCYQFSENSHLFAANIPMIQNGAPLHRVLAHSTFCWLSVSTPLITSTLCSLQSVYRQNTQAVALFEMCSQIKVMMIINTRRRVQVILHIHHIKHPVTAKVEKSNQASGRITRRTSSTPVQQVLPTPPGLSQPVSVCSSSTWTNRKAMLLMFSINPDNKRAHTVSVCHQPELQERPYC